MFGQPLSVPPVSSVVNPAEFVFNRNFGPSRPYRSSPHDHPTISLIKTSNAIRACSRAKYCAEPPTGNDSTKNRAATSGISVDSGPALRQNLKNRTPSACSTNTASSPQPLTLAPPPSAPPRLRMLRNNSLFPLTHDPNAAPPNCPLFSQLD